MDFEKFLEKMPDGLSDIEKARYIYINLGKYFSYDTKYVISETMEEKQKVFDKEIEDIENDKIICSTLSKLYVDLLGKVGIEAEEEKIEYKFCGHMFTSVKLNNKNHYTDLICDLMKIKKGFKTENFMIDPKDKDTNGKEFSSISEEELKKIDDKIGYTHNGMYMDEFVKLLKKEMLLLSEKGSSEGDKLRKELGIENFDKREIFSYKIDFIRKHLDDKKLYCTEKSDYFELLLKECISKDEFARFASKMIACKEDEENIRIFYIFRDKELNDNLIYTFSDTEFANRVDEHFIKEKVDLGMETISKKQEAKDLLKKLANEGTMVTREDTIKLLESFSNNKNGNKVKEYIAKINSLNEEEFMKFLEDKNVNNMQELEEFTTNLLNKRDENSFISINDMISYGHSDNTLHIHVVPKDVKNLLSVKGLEIAELALIDALEKISELLKSDETFKDIKQVYAVSGLIRKPISDLFENLDFDIKSMKSEQAKDDEELSKFYEIFKDKKYLGRAKLSKEKLFSEEWNKLKDERKEVLLKKNFLQSGIKATEEMTRTSAINKEKEKIKEIQNINKKQI